MSACTRRHWWKPDGMFRRFVPFIDRCTERDFWWLHLSRYHLATIERERVKDIPLCVVVEPRCGLRPFVAVVLCGERCGAQEASDG